MLYVTTRNKQEVYTPNHALRKDSAEDGGRFVPFKMPSFSPGDIASLTEKSFGQRMADMLNLLFGTRLTAWDVEFTIGRYPVRQVSMSHRITIAECWHNPQWDYAWLAEKISVELLKTPEISDWTQIAIRVALLFGIYDGEARDLAVSGEDLSAAMAALYAKSFGLPMGNIIICCRESETLWNLLHKGELRDYDPGLERFLHGCGGQEEVRRYVTACAEGKLYTAGDLCKAVMNRHIRISVLGEKRVRSAIPNVLRTSGYLLGPDTALCYIGLQDYRAVAGESRSARVLSDRSPRRDAECTASALGITEGELLNDM